MIITAVDPGKKGGIVRIDKESRKILSRHVIPLVKNKVDLRALHALINPIVDETDMYILEDVHSVFGASAKANFEFGRIVGVLEGMVAGTGMVYHKVQPKHWQKQIWTSDDMVYKKVKPRKIVDTKATSLLCSKRLFPNEDFLYGDNEKQSGRRSKAHDGLYDAALIAYWACLNF